MKVIATMGGDCIQGLNGGKENYKKPDEHISMTWSKVYSLVFSCEYGKSNIFPSPRMKINSSKHQS
jgi:hypothetical protein